MGLTSPTYKWNINWEYTLLKINISPWKMMLGRWFISFWNGPQNRGDIRWFFGIYQPTQEPWKLHDSSKPNSRQVTNMAKFVVANLHLGGGFVELGGNLGEKSSLWDMWDPRGNGWVTQPMNEKYARPSKWVHLFWPNFWGENSKHIFETTI